MKVLIVEDNADNRDLMTILLSTEGHTVIAACDGREGLSLALAHLPDLIITDISMPNLNGIAMIRELRARPEIDGIPIVVLSACNESEQATEAGASLAMSKPVRFEDLKQCMTTALDSQRRLVETSRQR